MQSNITAHWGALQELCVLILNVILQIRQFEYIVPVCQNTVPKLVNTILKIYIKRMSQGAEHIMKSNTIVQSLANLRFFDQVWLCNSPNDILVS